MRIGLVGTGKVAHQLAYAITKIETYNLEWVYGRSRAKADKIIEASSCAFVDKLSHYNEVDLVIIAVKDDAIHEVANLLEPSSALVVHTSGIKGLEVLNKHQKTGILYPLYSFYSKEEFSMENIPFLVDSEDYVSVELLLALSQKLSSKAYHISSEEKKQLHLAAVYANNFANHLMTQAFDILDSKSINKEILLPIIEQSCANWVKGNAKEHQSGPALRNDEETMNKHLEALKTEEQKEIYTLISKSILKYYS